MRMTVKLVQKKVVLIGNTSVGKTSIFNRVISDQYIESGVSTYSAYFRSMELNFKEHPSKRLKINLWDTAG